MRRCPLGRETTLIPRECKRLAEVDFPIAEVSRHAAKEKSIRHGHPSTLHLWWARRPLASSRAVLLALLLPDPCDEHCPQAFKNAIRPALRSAGCYRGATDEALRAGLLKFIGDFANWHLASETTYIEASRNLVRAAHNGTPPLVVDPFAGGGSIPLEALRLGCDTFASDLNPVACLILKTMLEHIPRHGAELAEDLRRVGAEIMASAEGELRDLYPPDADGSIPIAYLWARTVRCEAPDCGAEIPIYRSPWLSKKGAKKAHYFKETYDGSCVALLVDSAPRGGPVEFRIAHGEGRENPAPGFVLLNGTKAKGNNANVICPCCQAILPGNKRNPRVPEQLVGQRGGADVVFDDNAIRTGGARMLAVVFVHRSRGGRRYRLPNGADYAAVHRSKDRLQHIVDRWQRDGRNRLCPIPDEPLPPPGTLGFRVQRYGMTEWGDLFTVRQKVALDQLATTLSRTSSNLADELRIASAVAINRTADYNSASCRWVPHGEFIGNTFTRQALPIVWDFAEVNPFAGFTGSFTGAIEWVASVIAKWPGSAIGQTQQADATEHPLPDQSADIWFTDPPYYDAVPYADLSDFFLVWLKRTLDGNPTLQDPFDHDNRLSPKSLEAVQDRTKLHNGQPKDRVWFEQTMAAAFAQGQRLLSDDGIGAVVFAHKTTEGWEALLSGLVRGGWTITGSWPIATEMASRLRARESAALATSVHLICRRRPPAAGIGDWGDVLRILPIRVAEWMERLQSEGIRGADLVFACVGPALEVYSRYEAVETADGRDVGLAEFLEKVWEVVGRSALQQVLGTGGHDADGLDGSLEEDARLTALFLWTLQSTQAGDDSQGANVDEDAKTASTFNLPFDVVRRFAQPMGIDLDSWSNRVITQKKGVVRLMPVGDRSKVVFGADSAANVGEWLESARNDQPLLFEDVEPTNQFGSGRNRRTIRGAVDLDYDQATTLDRVHAAMLLQAGGDANALRTLIDAEQNRSPDFLRLANALSALYPRNSYEKRLVDAMLLAVPR